MTNPDDKAAFESINRHVDRVKVDLESLLLKYRDDPFKFHCIQTALQNANEIIYRVETALIN